MVGAVCQGTAGDGAATQMQPASRAEWDDAGCCAVCDPGQRLCDLRRPILRSIQEFCGEIRLRHETVQLGADRPSTPVNKDMGCLQPLPPDRSRSLWIPCMRPASRLSCDDTDPSSSILAKCETCHLTGSSARRAADYARKMLHVGASHELTQVNEHQKRRSARKPRLAH